MKLFDMKRVALFFMASSLALLVGCGGSDTGEERVAMPPPDPDDADQGVVYTGPIPLGDAAQFKQTVWDNLVIEGRCGDCHNEEVGQQPLFLRRDDVNLAYNEVISLNLVDLQAPALSRLVVRAKDGHNAWNPAAASIIENLITSWANVSGAAENVIVLEAPEEREVGATRRLPVENADFVTYIYEPILANPNTGNCLSCHAQDTATRQQPYFADRNQDTAYAAARTLIDVNNPANSRFVERMREGHASWAAPAGSSLTPSQYSTQEMLAAIQAFVDNGVPPPAELDPAFLVSRAVGIAADGVAASSGGRFDTDAIALYEFSTGSGSIAYDSSIQGPPLNLNLSPTVEWVGSWGIRIEDNGKATGSTVDSKKLNDFIKLTGEYSVEAWVVPANVTQEQARIITYSAGSETRNFSLNQTLYDYEFLTRSENTDANGMPLLNTPSDEEVLQATLQHVVATYSPIEGRKIYVNGELRASDPEVADGEISTFGGSISDWDDAYVLVLGNETDNARAWEGTVRLLAIHNRVLTPEQVTTNFDVGVGQKYYLLFGVSHLVDMPQAYVVFSVEVFDDHSYMFSSPFFISLDKEAVPTSDIRIQGMRIGINGVEANIGQAFANIDVTVNAANYDPNVGTPLATNPSGTLIALQDGEVSDLFFLSFENIGGNSYARPAEAVPELLPIVLSEPQPDVGLRIFDEIFESMSAITTVPSARIFNFYTEEIRRSLPSAETANGFLAAQQSAVTQLSLAFCTELVSDANLRNAYFGDYGDLSTSAMEDALIDPLLERMLIVADENAFATQPNAADIKERLTSSSLEIPSIDENEDPHSVVGLLPSMATNDVNTKAIAVCTSVLASASLLIQ